MKVFANAERVLAAVAWLALFALNDVRLFHDLTRMSDAGNGKTHAIALQLFGASEQVYVTVFDLAARWGLAALTVGLCVWAVAETLKPAKTAPN
jgi:hypothetical protein